MSGWIKLHRQLQDNPLWTAEPFSRGQAWVDLIMTANYKAGHIRVRGRRIDVGVGCVARSQMTLAKDWKWSRGKVIRFLKELEADDQIIQETSHDFNVIRLCNYTQFQVEEKQTVHDIGHGTVHETGHETVHGTVHIQEGKEGKEGKETTPPQKSGEGSLAKEVVISLPAKGGGVHDVTRQVFERCRENYPGLDVMDQLRAMRQHLEDNPHKRTPEWGCKTFISNWLNNRVGDAARSSRAASGQGNHIGFANKDYTNDPALAGLKMSGEGI